MSPSAPVRALARAPDGCPGDQAGHPGDRTFDVRQSEHLASYSSRLALDGLANHPGEKHRSVEGTLVFVDVSGYTALTERLAARGRAGAEEMNGIIGSTFRELGNIAAAYGADVLKWGGDAAVLLFEGPGSTARGARAAWLMSKAMGRVGRLRTTVGRVELQVSVGVHTGAFEFYLVGNSFRELVLAGPGATATVQMESAASAQEVVVSPAACALLDPEVIGEPCGPGLLLRNEPQAEERPVLGLRDGDVRRAASLLPERLWRYLLLGEAQVEHRPVASGFVQLSGLDGLIERSGAGGALTVGILDAAVRAAQDAADRYGVTFLGTDISADGFKILLLAGAPTLEGNDSDRLLRCLVRVVSVVSQDLGATSLTVRAGMNTGKLFVSSALDVGRRHIYSITGDALNLAARVVAATAPGEVRCTEAARLSLRSAFTLEPRAPFSAKGKSEPVISYAVQGEAVQLQPATEQALLPLVGREEELKVILAVATEVSGSGRGQVLDVVGPAGIGKSRLIEEAVRSWGLPTWRVACEAFSGGRPYEPLGVLARQMLGLDDSVPTEQVSLALMATVERRAPELLPWAPLLGDVFQARVPSTRQVDELEPRFRRARLEAVFVDLLSALVPEPAAFVFEDVHALDQASSSLVLRLAEETEHNAWLVVATTRPDVPSALEGATAKRSVVQLAALDEAAAQRILGQASEHALSPAERRALAKRAAGNPLFLLELARVADTTGSAEALPDSLEPLLASRIDRLAPADRSILRTAAVLGLRFQNELLAEVVDDRTIVDSTLWERLSEFVHEVDGEWVFVHALVRDAAYEGLAFRRRRELHCRAAEAIEKRSGERETPLEVLSVHWFAAERWDRAWDCSRQAGEHAARLY
ncbi:MAG TPA: adenylate/guanylate cyclase domain-containing protein, partial [Acidimicrobiales bacterium]|nr:adenylate/guanylate cyclase domain-containing protein [Acidimicrobiales bacterium]